MTKWTIGEREIEVNEATMQFSSNTPWRSSELDALRSLPSVRSVETITPHRIAVYPSLSRKVKEMAIDGVKAVVMIHVENVIPGINTD